MTRAEALQLLRLSEPFSQDQLKQAYRDLVKVWHPDRFQNDRALQAKAHLALQQLNAAYTQLQKPSAERGRSQPTPNHPPTPKAADTVSHLRIPSLRVALGVGAAVGLGVALISTAGAPSTAPSAPPFEARPESVAPIAPPLVKPLTADPNRPESATELLVPVPGGRGTLIIHNASFQDVAVVLERSGVRAYGVYVRTGEQIQTLNVPAGEYNVLFTLGNRWQDGHFTESAKFYELIVPVDISDEPAGAGRPIRILIPPDMDKASSTRVRTPFAVGS